MKKLAPLLIFAALFCFLAGALGSTYIQGPALIQGVTVTTASGTPVTLTVASETQQLVNGSTTQTLVLPDATTLPVGRRFYVTNRSTGTVTVNKNGGSLAASILAGQQKEFLLQSSGTSAGTWDISRILVDLSNDVVGSLSRSSLASGTAYRILANDAGGTASENAALTASRALISDTNGQLAVSSVTSATLAFLDASSSVQTQLNGKQATITPGNLTDAGTDGITVTGGTSALLSSASFAQHVASASFNGYLSSTDWSTFNGKQAAGSYLTAGNNLSDVASSATAFNNLSGFTLLGDTHYGGTSGARSVLAGNTTATKKFLTQTGNGSVSAAPGWNTIATTDVPSLTAQWNPLTQVVVDAANYATVQAAINAAEALSAASSSPGVAVLIPAGSYGENVVIHKNLALVGQSMKATQISTVSIRPTSSVVAPDGVSLQNLTIGNGAGSGLTVSNETASGSGVYFTSSFMLNSVGLNIINCDITDLAFSRVGTIFAYRSRINSGLGATILNVNILEFDHSDLEGDTFTYQINDADAHTPTIDIGYFYLNQSFSYGEIDLTRTGGTTHPTLSMRGTWLSTLVANNNSDLDVVDSAIDSYTLSGATHTISNFRSGQSFTPATGTDWSSTPATVDAGLNDLASSGVFKSQSANTFLASPNGSSGVPSFRAMVAADIPARSPTVQNFTSTGTTTGYVFTVTSANATLGATYTNNSVTFTVQGTISAGTILFASRPSGAPTASGTLTKASGTGDATITFSAASATASYTVPTPAPSYLEVLLSGGGGGGGGGGTTSGTAAAAGNVSYFGANLIKATGGSAGSRGAYGAAGGTCTITSPALQRVSQTGGSGGTAVGYSTVSVSSILVGGFGGSNGLSGPATGGSYLNTSTGSAGITNSGGGGGGGGGDQTTSNQTGSGGGAGGRCVAIVPSPTAGAVYPYLIGTTAAGQVGGSDGGTGGAGAAGLAAVTEMP